MTNIASNKKLIFMQKSLKLTQPQLYITSYYQPSFAHRKLYLASKNKTKQTNMIEMISYV